MLPLSIASSGRSRNSRSRSRRRMAAQARNTGSALPSSKPTIPPAKNSRSNSARNRRQSSFCPCSRSRCHAGAQLLVEVLQVLRRRQPAVEGADGLLHEVEQRGHDRRLSLTSIRLIGHENGREMPLVQGKNVGLGLFAHADPHHRPALLVHLQHVAARRGFVETEHAGGRRGRRTT